MDETLYTECIKMNYRIKNCVRESYNEMETYIRKRTDTAYSDTDHLKVSVKVERFAKDEFAAQEWGY